MAVPSLVVLLAVSAEIRGGFQRDALSTFEADIVREAQEIDRRTEIFVKIAERRLKALEEASGIASAPPTAPPAKESKKDREKREQENTKWGPPPTGSRVELLTAYRRILDELETKIDDAHERNSKNPALPKALQTLEKAMTEHLSRLEKLEKLPSLSPDEARALNRAAEIAENARNGAKQFLMKTK